MEMLRQMGVENAAVDMSIMRGHAYYTGIVFEFFLDNFPELGAVGGGGRYENLASKFSKTKIVGVGAAVGFSRLMVALMDAGRIDLTRYETQVDIAVLVMGNQNVPYALQIVSQLRELNISTIAYLDADKKIKAQFEYADKIGVPYVITIGDDEARDRNVRVKNMRGDGILAAYGKEFTADASMRPLAALLFPGRELPPEAEIIE